jgi:hypothetical protein
MLNLRGKCLILKSSWSGGLSGSCCSGAFDTTPNNSEIMRQIILKTTVNNHQNNLLLTAGVVLHWSRIK